MRTYIISLISLTFLVSCTALPGLNSPLLQTANTKEQSDTQTVYIASSRNLNPDGTYGSDRARNLSFASYDVTIPKNRKLGTIPASNALSSLQFGLQNTGTQNTLTSFSNSVLHNASAHSQSGQVTVFVHGFNTTFDISLYRFAQIEHDLNIPTTPVLYAWPSAYNLISYIHDLDSTTFAKDGLVKLLKGLSDGGATRIIVIGHSLGARLVMEAIRELEIEGNPRFFNHLGGVALLSPDIDLDLFNSQLEKLNGISAPIIAYLSHEDDTLQNFSNTFNEGKPRLGNIENVELLLGNPVTIVDVAHVNDPDPQGHLAVAASAAMITAINNMENPDLIGYAMEAKNGSIPGAVITRLGRSTHILLSQY